MEKQWNEIYIYTMSKGSLTNYETVKVDVVFNSRDRWGYTDSEYRVKGRRVRFDQLIEKVAKLHEQFPGCSHQGHQPAERLVAFAEGNIS